MSFQDRSKTSVQSLLAQLRAAQDDPGSPSIPGSSPHTSHAGPSSTPKSIGSSPSASGLNIPSTSQLNDILSSLNNGSRPSAFSGSSRSLIQPFGPVAIATSPATTPRARVSRPRSRSASPARAVAEVTLSSTVDTGKGKGKAVPQVQSPSRGGGGGPTSAATTIGIGDPGYGTLPFAAALPILTRLLGSETFKGELRKMKKDQEGLERRLWAKAEKVKADHERGYQAEREVAKLARRPTSKEKQLEWANALKSKLQAHHLASSLSAMDGLEKRQKERMIALGVPGLGGDWGDEKVKARVVRILNVLEGAIGEGE